MDSFLACKLIYTGTLGQRPTACFSLVSAIADGLPVMDSHFPKF